MQLPNLKMFSSSSVCCVLRIALAANVWLSRTDKSSGKLQPAHSQRGFQPLFIGVFRCQIAQVLRGADLLQRESPRLRSFLCPGPSHVKVSDSSRPNLAVHADVRRAVREHFELDRSWTAWYTLAATFL